MRCDAPGGCLNPVTCLWVSLDGPAGVTLSTASMGLCADHWLAFVLHTAERRQGRHVCGRDPPISPPIDASPCGVPDHTVETCECGFELTPAGVEDAERLAAEDAADEHAALVEDVEEERAARLEAVADDGGVFSKLNEEPGIRPKA